jgi:nitric oxide reductase large subunit
MIPKYPNSRYKTDTAADKFFIGSMVLLIVSVLVGYITFMIMISGLITVLLFILGIGGFFTLSYIVGNWIINGIEGRR